MRKLIIKSLLLLIIGNYAMAQGTGALDDLDNDGVININDLDDDNDGILDCDEAASVITNQNVFGPTYFSTVTQIQGQIPHDIYTPNRIFDGGLVYNVGSSYSQWWPNTGSGTTDISPNIILDIDFTYPIEEVHSLVMYNDAGGAGNGLKTFDLILTDAFGATYAQSYTTSATASSYALTEIFPFTATRYNIVKMRLVFKTKVKVNALQITEIGLNITSCVPRDTDGDGLFDNVDSDSDGDGCPDVVEAGHIDANGDGILDGTGFDSSTGQVTGYTTGYTGNTSAVIDASDNNSCCDPLNSGFTDTDGDLVADQCDIDDDNDGILDLYELTEVCDANGFNFSGIDTNQGGIPANGYLFQNRLLTTANTVYQGVTYDLQVTGYNGTGTSFTHIRGNNTGDLALTRDNNYFMEVKITFSEPVNFYMNEDELFSGNTGAADQWIFTLSSNDSSYYNYSDPGTPDFTVQSATNKTITVNFLGGTADDDWKFNFYNVTAITLRFNSFSFENTSILSMTPCEFVDIDTDADGVPDHLDLDADGDGCPDVSESGVTAYITDNGLNVTLSDVTGTGTNGIAIGTTVGSAQVDVANGGDTVGPDNGFHDALESGSAGVFAGTYLDLNTYYLNPATNNCVCYKFGTGNAVLSKVGISTLNRHVNKDVSHWPEDVPGGYLVLDSKEKGFVITRMSTAQIDAVANPVEGMLAYDTDLDCLKLYDGMGWICIEQTCDQ